VAAILFIEKKVARGEGGADAIERLQRIYALLTRAEPPGVEELIVHCVAKYPPPRQQVREAPAVENARRHQEFLDRRSGDLPSFEEQWAAIDDEVGNGRLPHGGDGNIVKWPGRGPVNPTGWMRGPKH
jgi:hypothetical protein